MSHILIGSVLALFQVIIVTLGQGALTLCVRHDGTQALEWTSANECQFKKSASHAACEHQKCCDEAEADEIAFRCNPCTDYVLVVDQIMVVDSKLDSLNERASDLCWYLPTVVDGYLSHLTSLQAHPPPSPLVESLADLGASVILRC
ncbi:MAG TPA: hypothetical protein PLN21_02700 [Gemmatales bacterium]|nr:hypothetical protein [Gemmatales bacterium]